MTQVLRFDGVNDHVTMPVIPDMTGNWQVQFKVTIRANANTVIAGCADFSRFLEMRVPTGIMRVRGLAGTSYDVPCPMAVGETCTILITSTVSPARLTVFKNGVQTGQVTFTQGLGGLIYFGRTSTQYGSFDLYDFRAWDGTVDRLYSAAGITSGTVLPELNNSANNGTLVNFGGAGWVNDELFTLPTTITPGVQFTSTVLAPYANGAATITFGNVSVPVTISGMQFTVTMPMFTDGGLYPKIPLTASILLVQGATSSTIFRPIGLPVGYSTVRDGDGVTGNPANFAGLITDDQEYIGTLYAQESNPLTVNDTGYWANASELIIYQDGSYSLPTNSAPITETIWILRGADNKTYSHVLNVSSVQVNVPQFLFLSVDFAPMGSVLESNEITVAIEGDDIAISIEGTDAEYSVNSGAGFSAWTSAPGTVNFGDVVKVRIPSSRRPGVATRCTLTIGAYEGTFTITTAPCADTGASIMVVNGNNPVEAGQPFTVTFTELNAADVMMVVLEKGSQTYYATITAVNSATQLTATAPADLPEDTLVTVRVYESKHARAVRALP